jgi:hypothetical protein
LQPQNKGGAKFGHFEAKKLASIVVKVTTADKKPLKDVLISISGGSDNYRKNSVTPTEGQLTFLGLEPGQYFLRAVLKEYQFEPSSQMFEVKEGQAVTIPVTGKRVAFSCMGVTDSLNGEPEVGVVVEAVGLKAKEGTGDCHLMQEEALSETDGSFRIRALKPGCKYLIRLKEKEERNQHLQRSLPPSLEVQVEDKDVEGLRLILFRRPTHMEVSGDVLTSDPQHLASLRVIAFAELTPDSPIATISLTPASTFFFLPNVPIDGRSYLVRLESSLSPNIFEYKTHTIGFTANASLHHLQFKFFPEPKVSGTGSGLGSAFIGDHDSTYGGNVYSLPLILLVTLIVYNYSKISPFVTSFTESVQALIYGNEASSGSGFDSGVGSKKKVKSRRT